jgi:hypothetical protein
MKRYKSILNEESQFSKNLHKYLRHYDNLETYSELIKLIKTINYNKKIETDEAKQNVYKAVILLLLGYTGSEVSNKRDYLSKEWEKEEESKNETPDEFMKRMKMVPYKENLSCNKRNGGGIK